MSSQELSASRAQEGQLQFELTLVTENLKFVTKDRDHWRLVADRARNEAETNLGKIHELTLANLELTRMVVSSDWSTVKLLCSDWSSV